MAAKPTILLTGATGYLGHHVRAVCARRALPVVTVGRSGCDLQVDLADPDSVARLVAQLGTESVLHAGAMTSVAACEADPARAERVNVVATRLLAAAAGARLLLVSTDLVFDGRAGPYAPDAEPRPLSVYGRTKLAAERVVLAAGARVVRVPLLFGPSFDGRRGASDMVLSALREQRPLTLFTDELRSPLHVADAAARLLDLLLAPDTPPLTHLPGPEHLTRAELGLRICAEHGLDPRALTFAPSTDPLRPKDVRLVSNSGGLESDPNRPEFRGLGSDSNPPIRG